MSDANYKLTSYVVGDLTLVSEERCKVVRSSEPQTQVSIEFNLVSESVKSTLAYTSQIGSDSRHSRLKFAVRSADRALAPLTAKPGTSGNLLDPDRLNQLSQLNLGNWSVSSTDSGSQVVSSRVAQAATFVLADLVPKHYRLSLDVRIANGEGSLNVAVPVSGQQTMVVLDGWGKQWSGLNLISGRPGDQNMTTFNKPVFRSGQRHTVEIEVGEVFVKVWVDQSLVIDWRGSVNDLSVDRRFWPSSRGLLYIGSWLTEFTIERCELMPL